MLKKIGKIGLALVLILGLLPIMSPGLRCRAFI